jgi:hypothetical protein
MNENEKVKKILKNVLYNSYAQAINKIFVTKNLVLKSFLLFFVLVSTALASYMIISVVLTYYSYGVVTKSRIVFEIPAKFPQITICNHNMFTTEYAVEFLKYVQENSNSSIVNIFDRDKLKNISFSKILPRISYIYKHAISIVKSKSFTDENRKKLGHRLKDILYDCKFNSMPCYVEDFSWEFDPIYGNCFSFNSNRSLTNVRESNIAGPLNGLQLQLFVNVHENLSEFYYSFTQNGIYAFNALGAVVKIDNSTYLTDHSNNGGIKAASGFHTDIAISRLVNINLPKPFSNCESDSYESDSNKDLVYLFFKNSSLNMAYTQQSCVLQCFQLHILKKCNCTHPLYTSLFEENVCDSSNTKEAPCFQYSWSLFIRQKDFVEKNCLPSCPLECNQTNFKTQLTSLRLTSWKYYLNLIQRYLSSLFISTDINPEIALESFVSLNIYYDSLSYMLTTEAPQMDWISLLGNIGGNLGLLLGVSFFSLCELVEVMIEIYFIKSRRNFNDQKTSPLKL